MLQVFVILFGVGKTETEGIYSLRAVTGSDGLPVDTIIAFESSEDAERSALHPTQACSPMPHHKLQHLHSEPGKKSAMVGKYNDSTHQLTPLRNPDMHAGEGCCEGWGSTVGLILQICGAARGDDVPVRAQGVPHRVQGAPGLLRRQRLQLPPGAGRQPAHPPGVQRRHDRLGTLPEAAVSLDFLPHTLSCWPSA